MSHGTNHKIVIVVFALMMDTFVSILSFRTVIILSTITQLEKRESNKKGDRPYIYLNFVSAS